ncbi:MAG: hypothetical protein WCI17_04940 [bacterium]
MKHILTLTLAALAAATLHAESPTPFRSLARMPVQEVTVFKDGHAFVLHAGKMPVDESGHVAMDYLPCPVIGTFWPYSADKKARLTSVTASQRKVSVERTALNLRELIEANVGAEVLVSEATNYAATILGFPAQNGSELELLDPSGSGEKLTKKGNVVLLKTAAGIKVVNLDRIQDISFVGDYKRVLPQEEFRNLLTLKLDWGGSKPQKEADVGLLYLQRGIRWIPNYKVVIDGKGQANVTLQATLINELTDLNDVSLNLVVGVPTFEFKDTVDPMSLQQSVAQLSQYFRQDAQTAYGFANAIMSQSARMPDYRRPAPEAAAPGMDLGPEIAGAGKNEDQFIYTVKHVTLRKGQRMVLPIGEFTLKYRDVFALEIPYAPPPEVWRNFDNNRQAELARLVGAPKVLHKIRLANSSGMPLTTAPALILRDDRVLAQGLMTYASPGAETDLDITTSVDIRVKKTDNETRRTPNATSWQGDPYGRIDLKGSISLTNFRKDAIEVEVVRHVLGNVDAAEGGVVEMVNIFEDNSFARAPGAAPSWWGWYSWPWWWNHFNGVGRITWTVKLEPNKPLDLSYTWNYYWR